MNNEKQEELFKLIDSFPYGIAITTDNKVIYINQAGLKIHGAKNSSEIVGKSVIDLIPPDYRKYASERMANIEAGKFASTDEEKLLRVDGSTVDVELTAIPFTYEGKPANYSVFIDITDRLESQRKLKEIADRYSLMFENFIDLYYQADMNGVITNISPSCLRLTGWSVQELLGRPVTDIYVNPEERGPLLQKLQKEGMVYGYEITLRNRAGQPVPCTVSSHIIKDPDGKPLYIEGTIRDITEQKDKEERLRVLFEASKDALMTLEPPTWKFTSGNASALKMFAAKNLEEFTSAEPWKLSPERQPDGSLSADKAKAMIEKALHDGSAFFEWTHRKLTGEDFYATVLLSKFELPGKVMLQATVRDITEQHNETILLKEKMDELEKMNALMVDREVKMVELKEELGKSKKAI